MKMPQIGAEIGLERPDWCIARLAGGYKLSVQLICSVIALMISARWWKETAT